LAAELLLALALEPDLFDDELLVEFKFLASLALDPSLLF
jgi:hypothetical protein